MCWQLLTAGRLGEGVSYTVESGEARVRLVASSPYDAASKLKPCPCLRTSCC